MTTLTQISLKRAERGLLLGGTGSGKSTAAEYLIPEFRREYNGSRVLIADSKPRFRAEWEPNGLPATARYKRWDHGAPVSGSMLVGGGTAQGALKNVWKHTDIAIVQCESQEMIPWLVAVIGAFFRDARASEPRLLYIDEGLDFFHPNGSPKGGSDAILRCSRAGRERGLASLVASQRPRGLPVQLISEVTKIYLFHLDFINDIKYLGEAGYPWQDYPAPAEDHAFWYWDKKLRTPQLMKLHI
jgi:hypothetical protein